LSNSQLLIVSRDRRIVDGPELAGVALLKDVFVDVEKEILESRNRVVKMSPLVACQA